mmetsp:Transcript_18095/g.25306  ORF Transcript_18095/g.25306 Transcript_18095/m.25306 type:complete len:371 (+) Transcript_18095:691-1803(+)
MTNNNAGLPLSVGHQSADYTKPPSSETATIDDFGTYTFRYEDKFKKEVHRLIMNRKQVTMELESTRIRYRYSFSTFLNHTTHITSLLVTPKLKIKILPWQMLSSIFFLLYFLVAILVLISMSPPSRSVDTFRAAAFVGVVPFGMVLITAVILASPGLRAALKQRVLVENAPRFAFSPYIYLGACVLSMAVFIVSVGALTRVYDDPNDENIDFVKFLNCEKNFQDNGNPYTFNGDLCQKTTLRWVRSLAILGALGFLVSFVGHILYFGLDSFPLSFMVRVDDALNPVYVTFWGTKAMGFPCSVMLTSEDAQTVRRLFYEWHDPQTAVPISVRSTGTDSWWLSNQNLDNKDQSWLGWAFKLFFQIITFGFGG